MKKRLVFVTLFVLLAGVVAGPAWAQAGISIEASGARYSFGQHVTFHLEARAPAPLTSVHLFLQVQGQMAKSPISVPITPNTHVNVDYVYSMAEHRLPPFATLTYWWTLQDADGNAYTSDPQLLYYADNRYEWHGPLQDQYRQTTLEVYWVEGDLQFAQNALNTALVALADLERELASPLPGLIRMFIYPSEQELRNALNMGGYDWAGGQARPELDAVLVGIPNDALALGEMERLVPHELTHLLVYQAVGGQLGRVPPWLDEGLATVHALRPDPDQDALLQQALAEGGLVPLKSLCAPFPQELAAARLAYAQSASVVQYIRERYGSQAIRNLLAAYADNASCNTGVIRALGMSLDGLDAAWRASLTHRSPVSIALSDGAVWLALWLLSAVLVLPFLGAWRARRSEKNS